MLLLDKEIPNALAPTFDFGKHTKGVWAIAVTIFIVALLNPAWILLHLRDADPGPATIVLGGAVIVLDAFILIAGGVITWFVLRPRIRQTRESNRLFEAAHTQSVLPKAWLDAQGHFLRVNPSFSSFFGLADADFVGVPFDRMLDPQRSPLDWPAIQAALQRGDGLYQRELPFAHRDGTQLVGHVTLSTLRNDAGAIVCHVLHIQDVTARAQVERDLRASEARFRAITMCSPVGISHTDAQGDCIYANNVFLQLTGLRFADAMGDGWLAAVHPEDRERVARIWNTFASHGGEYESQHRFMRPDKSVVWVRVLAAAIREDDLIVGYIGMVENITSQRESDLQMRESERRFRRLADSVPALIWMDDKDRSGAYVNKAWIDYTGNAELGNAWARNVHPDDRESYLDRIAAAWDKRRPYRFEYRLQRYDGVYRWFSVTAIPLFDDEGVFSGYIGSCMDIHDSTLAQQELQIAKDSAEAASVAKSNFLANVSHEFRTPMTSILGYADLLESPGASDLTAAECIAAIKSSGAHLLAMLNDILDLAKVEAGELSVVAAPCDVSRICNEVVDMMRSRALEKGLAFGARFLTPLPPVETDVIRLTQILVNLLGNAIKFTDEGRVALEVSADVVDRIARFKFVVRDTGVGIRPDQQERLFTPFFQADESSTRRFGGTGLGLAISRRLAQRLGGDLGVESDGVCGSTFTLALSARVVRHASVDASSGAESKGAVEPIPAQLGRVLVAEDGASTRKLLDAILRRAGADVVTCEDGQTAFELASEQAFDVIVLDMLMPELDGYTVASRLRTMGNRTPIIALTANAMSGDRERCLVAGCDDYLSKPIDRDRLIQLIARHTKPDAAASRHAAASAELPPEMADELRTAFLKEISADCDRLEEQLAASAVPELKRTLHQIKGSAAAFGFEALSQHAATAERSLGADASLSATVRRQIHTLLDAMRSAQPIGSSVTPPT